MNSELNSIVALGSIRDYLLSNAYGMITILRAFNVQIGFLFKYTQWLSKCLEDNLTLFISFQIAMQAVLQ